MSGLDEKQVQVTINLDTTPVLYTDGIQKLGNTNQQRIVARIGMSLSHAKKSASLLAQMASNPQGISKTGKKIVV